METHKCFIKKNYFIEQIGRVTLIEKSNDEKKRGIGHMT